MFGVWTKRLRFYSLPLVPNYDSRDITAQVDKIRSEIRLHGETCVGCDELRVLCPSASQSQELNGIAQIAEWEGWTFEYQPDGSVRFSNL
jgi:hypothetical protein